MVNRLLQETGTVGGWGGGWVGAGEAWWRVDAGRRWVGGRLQGSQ